MPYVPAAVELVVETVKVEVDDAPALSLILAGFRDAIGPAVGIVLVRVMLPAKPLRLDTWSVEFPDEPGWSASVIGLVRTEKSSPTSNDTTIDSEPLPAVAVTVTRYTPGAVEPLVVTVKVAVAFPPALTVALLGLKFAVGPAGDTDPLSANVPEKPPRLDRATVEVTEEPTATVSEDGLAEMENPVIFMSAMKVDQQFPTFAPLSVLQFPVALLWYSPVTQTCVGLDGSTPAPK
jgi:hypothetical protein